MNAAVILHCIQVALLAAFFIAWLRRPRVIVVDREGVPVPDQRVAAPRPRTKRVDQGEQARLAALQPPTNSEPLTQPGDEELPRYE